MNGCLLSQGPVDFAYRGKASVEVMFLEFGGEIQLGKCPHAVLARLRSGSDMCEQHPIKFAVIHEVGPGEHRCMTGNDAFSAPKTVRRTVALAF